MEIHPPEHGIHNWRQFLVHMSTVVLGILIAIGLEQSVEYWHHREQRNRLMEDMRTEAAANVETCNFYEKTLIGNIALLDKWQQAIWSAPSKHGTVQVTVSPALRNEDNGLLTQSEMRVLPTLSVWTTAKQSGEVPLLPTQTARFYDRLDYLLGMIDNNINPYLAADYNYLSLLRSITGKQARVILPQADVLTMTVEQRQTMLEDLAKLQSEAGFLQDLMHTLNMFSAATAAGATNREQAGKWLEQHYPVEFAK